MRFEMSARGAVPMLFALLMVALFSLTIPFFWSLQDQMAGRIAGFAKRYQEDCLTDFTGYLLASQIREAELQKEVIPAWQKEFATLGMKWLPQPLVISSKSQGTYFRSPSFKGQFFALNSVLLPTVEIKKDELPFGDLLQDILEKQLNFPNREMILEELKQRKAKGPPSKK